MFIDLPTPVIAVLNVALVPAVHFGMSWWFTRMPRSRFTPGSRLFRECGWEGEGRIYQRVFHIRRWKHLLPDAAPWFDGFPKKNLQSRDSEFLRTFAAETCRGEACHWAQIGGLLVAILWNPPWAIAVMSGYAVFSNLPCILLQRHNRTRIGKILRARGEGW